MEDYDEVIREYHKSIQEEFDAISNSEDEASLTKAVKRKLVPELPNFVDTIIELSKLSESDSVRLSSAKFGIQFLLGSKAVTDDSIDKLINSLTSNDDDEPAKPTRKGLGKTGGYEITDLDQLEDLLDD